VTYFAVHREKTVGMSPPVKGFGCRPPRRQPRTPAAGVRNPPRDETAGSGTRSCSGLYGDLSAVSVHLSNIIAFQGALPIKVGDDVIGAAGASGAPGGEKDEACVKAALDKVADQLN
jgi:hypothetical protein